MQTITLSPGRQAAMFFLPFLVLLVFHISVVPVLFYFFFLAVFYLVLV